MQPVQDELGSLELFTLHDERMPRVVFENRVATSAWLVRSQN